MSQSGAVWGLMEQISILLLHQNTTSSSGSPPSPKASRRRQARRPWADGNAQDDLAKPQDVEKGQEDAQVLSVVPADLPGAPEPQESAEPEP